MYITPPGKFEGEGADTYHFYQAMLDGDEVNGLIEIDESERKDYDISTDKKYVRVDESNDGFVSLRYFTAEEAEQWVKEWNGEESDWQNEDADYE